jgi:LysM repeat protein
VQKILPILKIVLPVLIAVVLLQAVNVPALAAPPAGGGVYYTVQYGDTLFSIGRMYGVNPYTIAEVNGLSNPNCIYAGQVLYIPSGGGWNDGCGRWGCGDSDTPRQQPQPRSPRYEAGYGYDYTGYYYYNTYPQYRRYSYTCGYYYNCY